MPSLARDVEAMAVSWAIRSLCVSLSALLMFATASTVHALERGDSCTIKAPLVIKFTSEAGTVESTLEVGALVEVVGVSDGGSARVRSAEMKGDVSTADLHSACAGTLLSCRLTSPVLMYEQNRSDSKSWRINSGAAVSVLKQGRAWAAVRMGDVRGFVKSEEMDGACSMTAPDVPAEDGASEVSEALDGGEGPGVLLVPFMLEGAAPADNADALLEVLYDRCATHRPDTGRLALDAAASGARSETWKEHIALSAKRARGAGAAYVVVGRLAMEPPTAAAPLQDRQLLQLGVVEAKTGKVLKAIRIQATTSPQDTWADKALAALLPALPSVPGWELKSAEVRRGFEVAPVHTTDAAPPPKTPAPVAGDEASCLCNPWGWLWLGTAVALGAGSAVVAVLAADERARANESNAALAGAITAGALGLAGAMALVTGVVVFATRAGLDE